MPSRRPKWASRHSPRAPSPCSTIVSMARCADATSVTATSSAQRKCSSVAWASTGPMNSRSGPSRLGQVLQAGLDRSVELADRVELLQMRDDLVSLIVRQGDGLLDGREPLGILDVHPLGPLEEGEMAERGFTEGQQLDPDAGRIAVGRHREVRAGKARCCADGGEQVLDERQVEHLLLPDAQQRPPPTLDREERFLGQPLPDVPLEREGRKQVLEHDQMLELGRLPERVDERLPVLEPGTPAALPAAHGEHIGERSVGDRCGLVDHQSHPLEHGSRRPRPGQDDQPCARHRDASTNGRWPPICRRARRGLNSANGATQPAVPPNRVAQADADAACRRIAPPTPLSSTGPISRKATADPPAASTTSWLTRTSPGRA